MVPSSRSTSWSNSSCDLSRRTCFSPPPPLRGLALASLPASASIRIHASINYLAVVPAPLCSFVSSHPLLSTPVFCPCRKPFLLLFLLLLLLLFCARSRRTHFFSTLNTTFIFCTSWSKCLGFFGFCIVLYCVCMIDGFGAGLLVTHSTQPCSTVLYESVVIHYT